MNYQQTVGLTALGILFFVATANAEDCQISLSQPVVDYHEMRRDNIDKTQQNWHKMADRTLNVNVYCPQPQQMAVLLQGTAGDKGRFTFGQSGGMAVKRSISSVLLRKAARLRRFMCVIMKRLLRLMIIRCLQASR